MPLMIRRLGARNLARPAQRLGDLTAMFVLIARPLVFGMALLLAGPVQAQAPATVPPERVKQLLELLEDPSVKAWWSGGLFQHADRLVGTGQRRRVHVVRLANAYPRDCTDISYGGGRYMGCAHVRHGHARPFLHERRERRRGTCFADHQRSG